MVQTILFSLADALVLIGVSLITIGVYGMIRLPNLYTQLHAASKAAVLGVIPTLLAAIVTLEPAVVFHALLIGALLLITTPVASHAIARAAFLRGERPGLPDDGDRA